MKHYIIIEVREPEDATSWWSDDVRGSYATHAGLIRKNLHDFVTEHGINIADNIIREDRTTLWDGSPNPYAEAKALFDKVFPLKYRKGGRES